MQQKQVVNIYLLVNVQWVNEQKFNILIVIVEQYEKKRTEKMFLRGEITVNVALKNGLST